MIEPERTRLCNRGQLFRPFWDSSARCSSTQKNVTCNPIQLTLATRRLVHSYGPSDFCISYSHLCFFWAVDLLRSDMLYLFIHGLAMCFFVGRFCPSTYNRLSRNQYDILASCRLDHSCGPIGGLLM